MKKTSSLGEEKDLLCQTNSSNSNGIAQLNNRQVGIGQGTKIQNGPSDLNNTINQGNVHLSMQHNQISSHELLLNNGPSGIHMNSAKSQPQLRISSRNQLADNESWKEFSQSFNPSASVSQQEIEIKSRLDASNIGACEGAEIRSRLFLENKDLFQPKLRFSLDEIPAMGDGDISFKKKITEKSPNTSAFKPIEISTTKLDSKDVYQPLIANVGSQGQVQLSARVPSQQNIPLSQKLNPSFPYQNLELVKNRSHINSQTASKSNSAMIGSTSKQQARESFQFATNNQITFSSHLQNGLALPPVTRKSQTQTIAQMASQLKQLMPENLNFPTVSNSSVFIKVNHFSHQMKKLLLFLRPNNLNTLQLSCIQDKASQDFKEVYYFQKQSISNLRETTRKWISKRTIFANLFFRKLKRAFKPFYIYFYQVSIQIEKFSDFLQKVIPCIEPIHYFWRSWEYFILMVTIINFVFIPLNCSFNIGDSLYIKEISAVIFFFDIARTFFTAFFEKGILIKQLSKVICHYLRSFFILDLISTLSLIVQPFRYASLIFFIRSCYGISISEKSREVIAKHRKLSCFFNLAFVFLNILFHCHLIACAWYFIGNQEKENSMKSWVKELEINNFPIGEQYLHSVYFAVITLTNAKGNILPQSQGEILFLIFCSIYAAFLLAYLFFTISTTLKAFNKNNTRYLNQLASINKYLDGHELSHSIKIQAQKYLEYINYEGMEERQESISSLNTLSRFLKEQIIKDGFLKSFSHIKVIKQYFNNQDFLEKLSMKVKEQVYGPGEMILKSNVIEMPCLYLIMSGEVDLFLQIGSQIQNKSQSNQFKILHKNDHFGDLEFFSQNFQTSISVKARGYTQIQYITLYDFQEVIQSFPDEKEIFCYLKDCVTLNCEYDKIGISCFSCKSQSHTIMKCPYLFYHHSKERILHHFEAYTQKLISNFKRSIKRKKFNSKTNKQSLMKKIESFMLQHEDFFNSSVNEMEEYQDEVDSRDGSFYKQQTVQTNHYPQDESVHYDRQSSYTTRKTSKKMSLKQTQSGEDYDQRKNSKNQSIKMLNPMSIEEVHEKSSISKTSQFSSKPQNLRGESLSSEEKKNFAPQSNVIGSSESDVVPQQNRKRTHSGISNLVNSRKSPFPSEREVNRTYSGSLISSLRLSEAEKKILILEERNGAEAKIQQIQQVPGAPNLFVIKPNERDDYSLVDHSGYSHSIKSGFAPSHEQSDYLGKRHNSNFSLISRNIVQSSQFTSTNQQEEFSELRLDQTNRFRENSFFPNQMLDQELPAMGYYLNNDGEENNFEEQQNFKIYFSHNNLPNIINQPKSKKISNLKPNSRSSKSNYMKVVSVNNKISNRQLNNQLDSMPQLLPGISGVNN